MASANLRVPDRAMVPRLLSMSSRVMPTPVSLPPFVMIKRNENSGSQHARSPHAQSILLMRSCGQSTKQAMKQESNRQKKFETISRFVRVILAQGPC